MTHFGLDSWSFPPLDGSPVPRAVQFAPRLVVNTVRAAVASAVEGHGVTRLFSYHIADELQDGRLQIVLDKDEPPPLPAHLLAPQGRFSVPKVRAFIDFAAPRLQNLLCPPVGRRQPQCRRQSFATRKNACRIAGIRFHIGRLYL